MEEFGNKMIKDVINNAFLEEQIKKKKRLLQSL